jgi:hypothetical protein
MLIQRPLFYRVFLAIYMVCVAASLVAIPILLVYALWKGNWGLLVITITATGIAVLAILLIRMER